MKTRRKHSQIRDPSTTLRDVPIVLIAICLVREEIWPIRLLRRLNNAAVELVQRFVVSRAVPGLTILHIAFVVGLTVRQRGRELLQGIGVAVVARGALTGRRRIGLPVEAARRPQLVRRLRVRRAEARATLGALSRLAVPMFAALYEAIVAGIAAFSARVDPLQCGEHCVHVVRKHTLPFQRSAIARESSISKTMAATRTAFSALVDPISSVEPTANAFIQNAQSFSCIALARDVLATIRAFWVQSVGV